MINVLGDAYGAGIIQKLSKRELERMDHVSAMATVNPSPQVNKTDQGDCNDNFFINGGFMEDKADVISFTQTSKL